MIFWNGKSSDDLHVIVEHYPERIYPARKLESISIPGRNGDIVRAEDSFENYTQPYDIYVSGEFHGGLPALARRIAAWLMAPEGYCKLIDSYDVNCFRYAYFQGPVNFENIFNNFGRATIEFNCQPCRFLIGGQNPVHFTGAGKMINSHGFAARPQITVTGSGNGTVTVGGRTVALSKITSGMILDSLTQNAYLGSSNLNGDISAAEFPVLLPGESAISFTGGVTALDIVPRWWTL